jgi:nucleotide-binding universal stress UspA family protein
MYSHILVPLDGSELAECSLRHAKAIAKGCKGAKLTILRVIEPMPERVASNLIKAGEGMLQKTEQEGRMMAKDYIAKVENGLKAEGFSAQGMVRDGMASDEIMDYTRKNNVDLIVMSTHGRSGISLFFFGSVAEKVSRHSAIPALLISPPGCRNFPAS